MEDVIKTFIIKYNQIEHYFDSAKYKRFVDINPSYCYDHHKYKSMDLTESIDSYPYFHLELDFTDGTFYEFKVLFNSKIDVLVENLTTCILLNKPKTFTLREFIDEIDKKITKNKCNWNVYASK